MAAAQQTTKHQGKRCVKTALSLVLAGALCFALAGCRWSNELIEVHHNQEASVIDYDTDEKYYESSDAADAVNSAEITTQTAQNIPNATQVDQYYPLAQEPPTTDEAIDLIEKGGDQDLDAPIPVPDEEEEPEEEDEPEEMEEAQTAESTSGAGTGNSQLSQTGGGSSGDQGQNEGEGEGETPGEVPGSIETTDKGHSPSQRGQRTFNESGGGLKTLEDVHKVATVGEYANMVMLIGGPDVLCAADNTFTQNTQAQKVFSDDGWHFADIPTVWTYDEGSDSYIVDFDALVASQPDLVLVPEGQNFFTDEQEQILLAGGTSIETAAAMDSVDDIRGFATWLGGSLKDIDTGTDAAARANSYTANYLQNDVNSIISENGGLTTYGGVDYSDNGQIASTNSNWTIFVTDWDPGAVFSNNMIPWTSQGLALATAGYGWSPVNYYFSAGGVNNNAAQYPDASSAKQSTMSVYPVWQYSLSELNPNMENFSGLTKSFKSLGNDSSTSCFVRAPAIGANYSTGDDDVVTVLGDKEFRYVLCATQEIASNMAFARDLEAGLYTAYPYITTTGNPTYSGVGFEGANHVFFKAWIGYMAKDQWSDINHKSIIEEYGSYGVATVGNGLYCDWINGSAESFLMTFWIDDFYDGDATYSNLRSEVTKFYKEFYNYDITEDDFNSIVAGRVN